MDRATPGGRAIAFRIVAALLALAVLGPSVPFAVSSLVSSDPVEQSHRVHTIGGVFGLGVLGVLMLMVAMRPESVNAFHAAFVVSIAWAVSGIASGDFVSGLWFTAPLGAVILMILHPRRSEVFRFSGRPSIPMLAVSLMALLPAGAYALTMAELQRGPTVDPHVELHHWSGMAASVLTLVGAGMAAGLRTPGWPMTAWVAVVATILFGATSIAFPDHAGALEVPWGWLAIAVALIYLGFAMLAAREDELTASALAEGPVR
jgi:hypothetical protein